MRSILIYLDVSCSAKVSLIFSSVLQSGCLAVCEVDGSLKAKLDKFRFRKETNNAAIVSEYHMLVVSVSSLHISTLSILFNLFE